MWARLTDVRWIWTLLLVSLAFNVGFGATYGVRTCQRFCRMMSTQECATQLDQLARLELTAEQRTAMTASRERMTAEVTRLETELATARSALADQLAAEVTDRAAFTAALDRVALLQRQVQEHVLAHLLAEKELLTPAQRAEFNQIVRECVCPMGGCAAGAGPGGCERHQGCQGAGGSSPGMPCQ